MNHNYLHQDPIDKNTRRYQSWVLILCSITYGLSACSDSRQKLPGNGDKFPLAILSQLVALEPVKTDLRNKTLLVNFWATWCTPCRKEMPTLQKLSDELDQSKFAVIGISVDDDINLVKEFLLQYKIQYPNFQDNSRYLTTELFKIKAFPETFIVSPQGIILKRVTGQLPDSDSGIQSIARLMDITI